ADRQDSRRYLFEPEPRGTAQAAARRRYCFRRSQQHERSGRAPASSPHQGDDTERSDRLSGARCDLCRRAARLWCRPCDRRTSRHAQDPDQDILMTEKLDLNHLRQWIGNTREASDVVTAQLVKELRATLFQEIGEPKGGDAAPFTVHWCLAQPVAPMS